MTLNIAMQYYADLSFNASTRKEKDISSYAVVVEQHRI